MKTDQIRFSDAISSKQMNRFCPNLHKSSAFRAEYRPLKPHRDISRYGKCISQCVLNISYKQESQFSISYRSQNLLHKNGNQFYNICSTSMTDIIVNNMQNFYATSGCFKVLK